MDSVNVLIADDHKTVRDGLRMLIERVPGMNVVGEAADGHEAITKSRELKPAVVVMDISMPGMSGLNATRKLKEILPEIKIVALTRHSESGYVNEVLQAGASGYVLKQSSSEELIRAIKAVVAGQHYLDPAVTTEVVKKYTSTETRSLTGSIENISSREGEVLSLIAAGYSNKEIGSRLDISVKTVEAHKANSMKKLGLKSRIDIVHFALLQGWLKSN